MPDQVTEWLQAFQIFMDHVSAPGSLVAIALATLATPLLIFVHELGHALAVRARGLPLEAMKVGHESDVVLTLGGFRMEFGRLTGKGDVGGYVLYDGRRSTPADVLVIALAGPVGNLLCAAVTGWLALGAGPSFVASLWLLTFGSVCMAVANLRVSGEMQGPVRWSDGRWARVAWRGIRAGVGAGPLWRDPHESASVPPPQARPS
jgi:Peptidase family M50